MVFIQARVTLMQRKLKLSGFSHIPGCGNFITTPQPLQLGGMATDKLPYQNLSSDYFNGVISEVVSNGYVLDLAEPRILENSIIGQSYFIITVRCSVVIARRDFAFVFAAFEHLIDKANENVGV